MLLSYEKGWQNSLVDLTSAYRLVVLLRLYQTAQNFDFGHCQTDSYENANSVSSAQDDAYGEYLYKRLLDMFAQTRREGERAIPKEK